MKRAKITYKVTNDKEHADLVEKVGALMKINSANTTREERQHIRAMGEALMAYEQSIYPIPEPSTLEGILEQRMYDMRCENKDLAQTLGISQEELEMIINGDQKPDISLLKVIREKLDIPADFILDHV
ncbi:helix-turn-helix domain-containing protein [Dyadobacter sp. CY261]|uniref:helix-turn-helix domain-containing protein n=1 Tax=Dyadobacter sp. CY261 TaxID=2907203 RepID=UPI001F28917F|nr:helix-turn-helix transcriptional regulator [Dyadobacter sp. CY261]MCF0072105.1 helix-turn-helix domain-containing protein [Dyadobacter sp. CY261]